MLPRLEAETTGVVLAAYGHERFVDKALRAAKAVEGPATIVSVSCRNFIFILKQDRRCSICVAGGKPGVNQSHRAKIEAMLLSPYDRTLFLDVDAYPCVTTAVP